MPSDAEVTSLLRRFQAGDADAGEQLVPLIHGELHRLAHRALARLPAGGTLQTTALLHEAWMRVDRDGGDGYASREHFLAVAAKAMRGIVVDRARRRSTERHGATFEPVELDDVVDLMERGAHDLLALDEALDELAAARPELARVVEQRFFAGMSHVEIAKVEGIPLRRVERNWSTARAWLFARLAPGGAEG